MAGYKAVLFFNAGNRGWTETWYSQSGSVPTEITTPIRKALRSANVFRAEFCDLFAVRFSDLTVKRNARTFDTSGQFTANDIIDSPTDEPPDVATTDAVYKFGVNAGGNFKRMFIRGLVDSAVKRSATGIDIPSGILIDGMAAYFRDTKAIGWGLRIQSTPVTSGFKYIPVLALTTNNLNPNITEVTVLDNPAAQFTDGRRIRFAGNIKAEMVGFPRQSQIIKVNAGPPITFTMIYRLRNPSPFVPLKLSAITLEYQYSVCDYHEFVRFSERKTGRPFGSLAGKLRPAARAT